MMSEASIKDFVQEKAQGEDAERKIITEAYCTSCLKQMKLRPVRPISNSNWRCDGCGTKHSVKPGFQFYTCKKCHNDWCPKCFKYVEVIFDPHEKPLLDHDELIHAKSEKGVDQYTERNNSL